LGWRFPEHRDAELIVVTRHCERSVAIQKPKTRLYGTWIATLRSQ
jgi:hypothetical protein